MCGKCTVVPEDAPEFEYKPLGTIAYIGHDKAVLDPGPSAPFLRYIRGWLMGLGWKSAEVFMQISYKNMCAPSLCWPGCQLQYDILC